MPEATTRERHRWWSIVVRTERSALLGMALVFAVSRWYAFSLGVHFDSSTLFDFWQILDPELLRNDLLRSVWWLHSQPPAFNLFLGSVLKLFPVVFASVFALVYKLCGALVCLLTFGLLRILGLSRLMSGTAALLVVVRPSFILYENWLTYDLPATTLVLIAASLLVANQRAHVGYGVALAFWTLTVLCATRSLFQWVFPALLLCSTCFVVREHWPRMLKTAVFPLLALATIYIKSLVLFGVPTTSSWLGMNLARVVSSGVDSAELWRLQSAGKVSSLMSTQPFSPVELYPATTATSPANLPVLVSPRKSTGAVNYNHYRFIEISRSYLSDSLKLARIRPDAYLAGIARAVYNFTVPPQTLEHLAPNSAYLTAWSELEEIAVFGRLPWRLHYDGGRNLYLFVVLAIPGLAVWAAFQLSVCRRDQPAGRPARLWLFILTAVAYVTVVGSLFEVWENQRFRFYIEPLLVIALTHLAVTVKEVAQKHPQESSLKPSLKHGGRELQAPRKG